MELEPLRITAAQIAAGLSVCFVHTPCLDLRDDRLEPPLGILSLAATLRERGVGVRVVDLAGCADPCPETRIPDGHDVYGFSTYSVNYRLTKHMAEALRARNPKALLVAGGPHATALPAQVTADGFDVVITGEAELALAGIVEELARGARPQGVIRGEGAADLNMLPFPAFDLVNLDTYTRELTGSRCLSVLSARGCPYPCSFCNSNIMGAGRPMRYRSPENVVTEIRMLRERYGVRHIRFQDDIFTVNRQRLAELLPRVAAEDVRFRCFARVNTMSQEMARMLAESGCVHVSFGVESGSPTILGTHAMHKGQTPAQIQSALHAAHEAGIRVRIFLIVGFPGETDDTVAETLALVRSCPWDEFSVYPLIAYPGTPLHDHPERYGITYIDKNYSDYLQIGRNYRAGFTIRTETFDEHKVRQWRDLVIHELRADGRLWAGDAVGNL